MEQKVDIYDNEFLELQPMIDKEFEESCELCTANIGNPIITHLRSLHPGCGTPTLCGFDVNGTYKQGGLGKFKTSKYSHCGSYGNQKITGIWYMYCPNCQNQTLSRLRPWVFDAAIKPVLKPATVPDHATVFGERDYCPLCGISVSLLVVSHIRSQHPGCATPTLCGYDKHGIYKFGRPEQFMARRYTTCGSYGEHAHTGIWYMYCPDCRGNVLYIRNKNPKLCDPPTSFDNSNIDIE